MIEYLFVANGVKACSLNPLSMAVQAHVTQHHNCTEQQGCRVGEILPCNIWCSSMDLTRQFNT